MRPVGAILGPDGRTSFRVWAPLAQTVELHLVSPIDKVVPMQPDERGYHHTTAEAEPGTRYLYRLDGRELPDPASRYQPEGVHGPSEVTDPTFGWSDHTWFGLPLRDYVLYELHTGTFTPQGTFEAIVPWLSELRDLGVTVIELMPVAQFPGTRNWGYDGVYPYAPQASYGGPEGLKRLVDACHARGLGVCLDVVYNHLGPEGCYVDEFGPYFTDAYITPWGRAMNFDGPDSDEVRTFFIGNALYWFEEFHIDALRLDAVHAILDTSALPFLEELALATADLGERLNRRLHLIAESADNDARIIAPRELGGFGLDAQWNDDFHHALHALVTGERAGYYADYGDLRHLARAYADGFVYQGEYSGYRRRRHGRSSRHRGAQRFVVFTRNHDQIGNRMLGERPTVRLDVEELKLTAAVMLLSPYLPLLFMGEEYAETAPFL
jgi:maltooligosyltrehalose trehalohydrolase